MGSKRKLKLYDSVLRVCRHAGEWQHALSLLDAMARAKVEIDALRYRFAMRYSYNGAINTCEKRGEWKRALGMLGAMAKARIEADTTSYNTALRAYEKGG